MSWKEISIEMKNSVKKYLEYCEEAYESGKNDAYTVSQLDLLFNEMMRNVQTIDDMVAGEEE